MSKLAGFNQNWRALIEFGKPYKEFLIIVYNINMENQRQQKASTKLTTEQESALRNATSDYQLNMKYVAVKNTIASDPRLEGLSMAQLTNYVTNEKKRRKRYDNKSEKIDTTQCMKMAESEPQKRRKLSQMISESNMASGFGINDQDGIP